MKEHRDEFLLQGVLGDELDRLLADPLDLLVEPLDRVFGVDLPPKRLREFVEGEEVAQGIGPFGDGFVLGAPFPLEFGERPLRLLFARSLGQRHEVGGGLLPFRGPNLGAEVPHQVEEAPLPFGFGERGVRGAVDAGQSVGDDGGDLGQAPGFEIGQK